MTLTEFTEALKKDTESFSNIPIKFVDPGLLEKAARIIEEMRSFLSWVPESIFNKELLFKEIYKIINDEIVEAPIRPDLLFSNIELSIDKSKIYIGQIKDKK